jgi:hypothetical protein
MLRTIADTIIAAFIAVLVGTGIVGALSKRIRDAIFNRLLGGLWQKITEPTRQEEQEQKIQLITQDALAKQMTAQEAQRLREAEIRRGRIRAAHDQLAKTYTMLSFYPSRSEFKTETVGEASQALAQLRVECPQLSGPLDEISRSLLSPLNIQIPRARELLDQVSAGVEYALRHS